MLICLLLSLNLWAQDPLPSSLVQLGHGVYYSKFAFVVDKGQRQLSLWENQGGELVQIKTFLADMGKSAGDKGKEGDHKTPEGVYFFQEMLQGKAIPFELYGSRAFTTDYPNYFDKREGKTGSGIWLHAVPDKTPLTRGSRGCVVIRNRAVLQIEPFFTPKTTPIIIEARPQYVDRQQILAEREKINELIADWIETWTQQDLDGYINHYHEDFRGRGMNRKSWHRYKTRIASFQKDVKIRISKPLILRSEDTVTVRFLQDFQSSNLKDFGEKTLYFKKQGDDWKIFGEFWQASNNELARSEWNTHRFERSNVNSNWTRSSNQKVTTNRRLGR